MFSIKQSEKQNMKHRDILKCTIFPVYTVLPADINQWRRKNKRVTKCASH